ncbi:uncharacterized protein CcaverHIS019_0206030 [Cutaneotrichosporon cavernicola]|uniref:Zn(2)-C6 fungal-type domain-containing protein n=1 Tax=Cutaneotrichosporon cavernicola TaxID=279322 RepID=A0AA48L005_9TREE|nr:uncharacterized protein CcaverHIS019_0206030 [Cutaneotrichosporon cavernicola]BEI89241.1 hypothetical protein CcaverHIS019_0206030 [Cutaneotrichosporon cavernicola]BEI97016.1 hypothetical protein CcaverHIS631_0206050 [Cutaneotrichosporon cavernicola]
MDPGRFVNPTAGPSTSQQPAPARPQQKKRPREDAPPRGMSGPAGGTGGAGDLSKVRAFAACRACRQKKVKCLPGPATGAGGNAACQQCTMSGAECEYQPTRDRAAYSRAYVQDLSGRVQQLEAMQARLLPLLTAFEASGGKLPADVAKLAAAGGHPESDDAPLIRSRLPSPADDEDEESARFLTDEHGNYRWIGGSSALSLMDSFSGDRDLPSRVKYGNIHGDGHQDALGESPPESHPYFAPVAGAGVIRAIPGVDQVTFPPRADSERMVDAFFAEVHPVLPVLLEHDFRRRFKSLMDKVDAGDFSNIRAGFMSVVFAVFALGERVLVTSAAWQRMRAKLSNGELSDQDSPQPGEAEAGVIWFERAQVLHYSSIGEIDIYQVQCLTLLSAFQAAVNSMPMSWLLASQALRIAQDIGLHRSAPRFKVSFKVKQLGARAWWAVYGLERLVSITLGRPLCVEDADIDLAYPAAVDDATIDSFGDALTEEAGNLPEEKPDCTMSGFVALTKLCKIAGRVAQLLYRPSGRSVNDPQWSEQQQRTIDKLDKLLREWLQNEVPSKYKDPSSSRAVSLMSAVLSNSYFAVLITLHRNLLPSNPNFPRPKPIASSQSLAHCVEAARSVIHVAAQSKVLVPVSHHLAVFCQYLWSSAVILLLCETRAKEQVVVEAVGAHVESCRQSLHALEPVWPGASKLRYLLGEVETRAKEVRASAARPNKRRKPDASANGRARPPTAQTSPTKTEAGPGWAPPTGGSSGPSTAFPTPPIPQNTIAPSNLATGTFDIFDVGGMTFDGLEMLNAFTSDAWQGQVPNTSTSPMTGVTPTGTAGSGPESKPMVSPAQRMATEVQTTPTLSPHGPTGNPWQQFGHSPGGPVPPEIAEIWSQIAGSTFDWQADPSVPFNI